VPGTWRKRAHWIAGLVLIAIGVRVLVEHAGHM
jgi:putative Mn2+ efflux pump MntP